MARRITLADVILRQDRGPAGVVEIMSCRAHLFRAIAEMRRESGAEVQVLSEGVEEHHWCKGCDADW